MALTSAHACSCHPPSGRVEPRRGEGLILIFENRLSLTKQPLSGAETPTLPRGESVTLSQTFGRLGIHLIRRNSGEFRYEGRLSPILRLIYTQLLINYASNQLPECLMVLKPHSDIFPAFNRGGLPLLTAPTTPFCAYRPICSLNHILTPSTDRLCRG